MAIILQHINVPSQSLVHLTFSQFYMSNVFQFLKASQIKGELPWKKELCLPDAMMPSTPNIFQSRNSENSALLLSISSCRHALSLDFNLGDKLPYSLLILIMFIRALHLSPWSSINIEESNPESLNVRMQRNFSHQRFSNHLYKGLGLRMDVNGQEFQSLMREAGS